jgi:hypothetical protein
MVRMMDRRARRPVKVSYRKLPLLPTSHSFSHLPPTSTLPPCYCGLEHSVCLWVCGMHVWTGRLEQ